jgi:hypothetical protein
MPFINFIINNQKKHKKLYIYNKKEMAKSKKTAGNSKKTSSISDRKPVKKIEPKINQVKVETISKKINEINNNFECLIDECRSSLAKLKNASLSTV